VLNYNLFLILYFLFRKAPISLILFILLLSCNGNSVEWNLPKGFPVPEVPKDNLISKEKVELGKALFFDPILSRDSTISCASCHNPTKAFTDNLTASEGLNGVKTARNTPTLLNVSYSPYFFMDGGVPTLEMQSLAPIDGHQELGFTVKEGVERLEKSPRYLDLFNRAFGTSPTAFGLTRAIASYERTLVAANSKYDQFSRSNDSSLLSENELMGLSIFFADSVGCVTCHPPPHFSTFEFENNGIFKAYSDTGRQRITMDFEDRAKFKVPTLRNIEYTWPYMHNGKVSSLEEVISLYVDTPIQNKFLSKEIRKPKLNMLQKEQLLTFLRCLSDTVTSESIDFK
jgi:cytochrome c peroxidase